MAKKKAGVANEDSTTFVRVGSPSVLREEILHSAIDSTSILKSYERYGLLRDKKITLMKKVRTLMRKIEKEFKLIREKQLPKVEEIERDIELNGKKKKEVSKVHQIKKTKVVKTSLDRDIDEIRKRLSELKV
ncbi:hypothetical protein HOA59_00165 [archaeon]|jgi:hypothetical protein|nr:hypothetical protein [archaeon]MBT6823837.1 hypothetical protein [archaeon]MBT7107128.1 hypothetical protein [archaeon]MBT7297238.1 hypothetical protein [archaeon]